MNDMAREPSMEDILSSIKKIIAEDDAKSFTPPRARPKPLADAPPAPSSSESESVLELTENVPDESLISADALAASRKALSNLSRLTGGADQSGSITLDALVRDMLAPLLKDWLDVHLPAIVERTVAQEVARITQQSKS